MVGWVKDKIKRFFKTNTTIVCSKPTPVISAFRGVRKSRKPKKKKIKQKNNQKMMEEIFYANETN